jgi:hypothetical protein
MKRAAAAAGLGRDCIPDGLRNAVLRRLTERGGTVKELQSISRHATLFEIARYTKAADQKQRSVTAINKLKRRTKVSNRINPDTFCRQRIELSVLFLTLC